MGVPIGAIFNAINGCEFLSMLLKMTEAACQNSGLFDLNTTYPIIKNAKVTIEFEAYPRDPEKETLVVPIPIPTKETEPREPLKAYRLEEALQGVGSEIAPDDIRQRYDIPIPTPTRDAVGIVERLKSIGKKSNDPR